MLVLAGLIFSREEQKCVRTITKRNGFRCVGLNRRGGPLVSTMFHGTAIFLPVYASCFLSNVTVEAASFEGPFRCKVTLQSRFPA